MAVSPLCVHNDTSAHFPSCRIGAIALILAVATILDQLFLYLSVRNIKRKESTLQIGGDFKPHDLRTQSLGPMLDSPVQEKRRKGSMMSDISKAKSFSVYSNPEQDDQNWQTLPFLATYGEPKTMRAGEGTKLE